MTTYVNLLLLRQSNCYDENTVASVLGISLQLF